MTIPRNLSFLAQGASSTGVLSVSYGGTGNVTLTGLAYGNGTSAFTAATAAQVVSVIGTTAVTNSTNTTNIASTDNTSTNANYYPIFQSATGGTYPVFTSSTNFKYNPLLGALTLAGALNSGNIFALGGTTGTTLSATNYIGSANSAVQVALEVRQQYSAKDALVVTTNQALSAYLLRVQENAVDQFVVRGTGTYGLGVGIGTSLPNATLDVTGPATGYYGGATVRIGAGTTAGTTDFYIGQYSAIIGGGGQNDIAMYNYGSGSIHFYTNKVEIVRVNPASFSPAADNSFTLGTGALRWSTVYAATALINTSDANQKQQIANLTIAEQSVAKAIKGLFKTFKLNDSVVEKGENARIHVGVIAQDIQAAFIAQGLNPNRYALFCSDTWWEYDGKPVKADASGLVSIASSYVENGETIEITSKTIIPKDAVVSYQDVQATQVTQLGVRYDELLCFVISAL